MQSVHLRCPSRSSLPRHVPSPKTPRHARFLARAGASAERDDGACLASGDAPPLRGARGVDRMRLRAPLEARPTTSSCPPRAIPTRTARAERRVEVRAGPRGEVCPTEPGSLGAWHTCRIAAPSSRQPRGSRARISQARAEPVARGALQAREGDDGRHGLDGARVSQPNVSAVLARVARRGREPQRSFDVASGARPSASSSQRKRAIPASERSPRVAGGRLRPRHRAARSRCSATSDASKGSWRFGSQCYPRWPEPWLQRNCRA